MRSHKNIKFDAYESRIGETTALAMKDLISSYKEILKLETADFSRIDHEDTMVSVVYKILQKKGPSLILKICDRPLHYKREVHFLKHFVGIVPVPKIIQTIEPSKDIPGAILMEYVPGELLKPHELSEALAYEIGRSLALIHSEGVSGYGDLTQDELSADPRIHFTLKFQEGLDECKSHLPKALIEQCQKYYEANAHLLMSVDGPCIVHRDFRPGNLIVHEGKLEGIIDWAGARAGFTEEDLCSLEHSGWSHHSHRIKHLLTGYAQVRTLPNYTRLTPFLRFNKAIATIGFTVKRDTWQNKDSHLYRYNRQFLEQLFKIT